MESVVREEKGSMLTWECGGSGKWKDDAIHYPEGQGRRYFPEGQKGPKSPNHKNINDNKENEWVSSSDN